MKKGTIKVSILYPFGNNKKFDMDYYLNKHVPMVTGLLGDAIIGATIEKGLGGDVPDAPPTYVSMGNIYFETMDSFQNSFGPHAETIMSDIPNYTNIEPIIQVSEVLV